MEVPNLDIDGHRGNGYRPFSGSLLWSDDWRKDVAFIAESRGLTFEIIIGPDRKRAAAWARFEAWAYLRQERGWTLNMISRQFGGRDHTTVRTGVQRYYALVASGKITIDP